MYRAIQDQLNLYSDDAAKGQPEVSELRQRTADYIRSHKQDFVPFLVQVCMMTHNASTYMHSTRSAASSMAVGCWFALRKVYVLSDALSHVRSQVDLVACAAVWHYAAQQIDQGLPLTKGMCGKYLPVCLLNCIAIPVGLFCCGSSLPAGCSLDASLSAVL